MITEQISPKVNMSLARKVNLKTNEEQTNLQLKIVKGYLVQLLEKTHNQKQILENECRKTQDILKFFRSRKKLFELKQNGYEESKKHSPSHVNSAGSLEDEEEIVSEINAAIKSAKNVMMEIENKMKTQKKVTTVSKSDVQNKMIAPKKVSSISKSDVPNKVIAPKKVSTISKLDIQNKIKTSKKVTTVPKSDVQCIKRLTKEKNVSLQSSKEKNSENNSLSNISSCRTVKKVLENKSTRKSKDDLKKDFKLSKKCDKTSLGESQFLTTYKKDFVTLNRQIKTDCLNHSSEKVSSTKNCFNSGESFNFKGIDDILQRVTPYPTKVSNTPCIQVSESAGKAVASKISSDVLSSSSPYLVNDSCQELIKVFNSCQKLMLNLFRNETKHQNRSASYLQKLNGRGNSFTPSSRENFENYKISMEMMSKCCNLKRKEYAVCLNSDIEDVLRIFLVNEPVSEELDLKVSELEAKHMQLKLLDILLKEINSCHSFSTLFYKTCRTLMDITPTFKKR